MRLRGTPSRVRFAAPYSRALDRASPLRQINFLEGDAGGMFAFLFYFSDYSNICPEQSRTLILVGRSSISKLYPEMKRVPISKFNRLATTTN